MACFNKAGLEAWESGQDVGKVAQKRVLAEALRQPEMEREGTITRSLSRVQWAKDGLPEVSISTIWLVSRTNSFSW